MKKAVALILLISVLLCGCKQSKATKTSAEQTSIVGLWITVYEIEDMMSGNFQNEWQSLSENIADMGINRVYLHVRGFGETLYKSDIFPQNEIAGAIGFDVTEYMLKSLKQQGVSVFAWINPYRISTNEKLSTGQSEFIRSLEKGDVCTYSCGKYLNPASENVRKIILSGIREVMEKYNFDGIHFDDYFYPTVSEEFDKESYQSYSDGVSNPLSLAQYRRNAVTSLISGVSAYLKTVNKQFGISPAASIEHNVNNLYADVISFCRMGLIDEIVPQLYFGFHYPKEEFCFEALFESWQNSLSKTDTRLLIGLNSYKIGTSEGNDAEEWQSGTDVLANQIKYVKNHKADGYVIFSASTLFSEKELNKKQRENIKNIQGE